MLAATRPTSRGKGPRARGRGQAFANGARRVGAFMLARPGTVAMTLLFGGLGAVVSTNALWMQSSHHPAPLFRQAALQPQHPVARKAPDEQPAAGSSMPRRPRARGRAARSCRPRGRPVSASRRSRARWPRSLRSPPQSQRLASVRPKIHSAISSERPRRRRRHPSSRPPKANPSTKWRAPCLPATTRLRD